MKKKGRRAQRVDPNMHNKMVTLRIDGDLFNAMSDLSDTTDKSLNVITIEALMASPEIKTLLQLNRKPLP
jgi:hypothetical protein